MKLPFFFLVGFFILSLTVSCKRAEIIPTNTFSCNDTFVQNHARAGEFQSILNKYVKNGLPGISLLVEDSNGRFTGTAGMADIAGGVPFTSCHVSKAASITKLMTGTLALMLQEKGILDLDDPLSKYIDGKVLEQLENAKDKTIRHCLNHTTGIYDLTTNPDYYLAVLNNPIKRWEPMDLLPFAYGKPGYPLDKYKAYYSNTNTVLVVLCIERATGQSHASLLKEMIWNPLKMYNTFYQGHDELPDHTAQGYFDLHSNGGLSNVSNFTTGSGNGYGGVFSNVFDLYRFSKALFDDRNLLNSASMLELQDWVQEDDDFFTGAGAIKKFTRKADYGVGHTGRDLGYSANLFWFPNRRSTMVFFVNYGTNGDSKFRQVFRDFENEITDAMLR
jgi:D-alanyl-D-alanine carboxypeptidase